MKLLLRLKSVLLLLFGVMNASQPSQPQPAPKPQRDAQLLLKKLTTLPDLLFISRNQANGGDSYALQKKLEQEYRAAKKAFKITVVYRHMDQCSTGEHQFGGAKILIVNAKGESAEFDGMDQHEIETHGAAFPPAIAAFLRNLPDPPASTGAMTPGTTATPIAPALKAPAKDAPPPTLPIPAIASGLAMVDFPGSITIERDIPDAYAEIPETDARWAVPKALRFSPPSQVAVGGGPYGPIRIEAWLSNPTAKPIKVALWQVGYDLPFHLGFVEDAVLKREPPDPNLPPQPPPVIPVPLPPIRITVPAKTAIRFHAQRYLAGFVFKSGGAGKLVWSFHYWKATEEKGTLTFELP